MLLRLLGGTGGGVSVDTLSAGFFTIGEGDVEGKEDEKGEEKEGEGEKRSDCRLAVAPTGGGTAAPVVTPRSGDTASVRGFKPARGLGVSVGVGSMPF